jgi:sigma-B regulation protein RsbU (phosphoserine phosphatase)
MKNHVAVFVQEQIIFEQLKEASNNSIFIMDQNPEDTKGKFIICDLASYQTRKEFFNDYELQFLYVISNLTDEENMKLVKDNHLCHLVGHNDGIFGQEIISHLKKVNNKKIWGIAPYMEKEADIKILSLNDSKFTNEMIQDALKSFNFDEYFSSPIEYIKVMANELISNSLYKGPNKRREEQGLSIHDRKSTVFLKGSDLVQVTLAMGEKGVALSVQDSFGGLTYNLLIASLMRSFKEKTVMEKKDGAGLGLYLTFLHSNQFIVNFRDSFRTEVICIIEKNKRYKNYKQRIRSFHFFQEVTGEKANDK